MRIDTEVRGRLLDVGCGTGALLHEISLSGRDLELNGIDFSPAMLTQASEKLGSTAVLRKASVESIPFPDAYFSIIVSANAFHYFPSPSSALKEMRRVLVPGGHMVITDWCDDFITCRICDRLLRVFDRAHLPIYSEEGCRSLFKKAGFEGVRVESYKINWLWGLMTATATKSSASTKE